MPEPVDTVAQTAAVRDEHGAIRRRRDGLFIADPDTTAEQLETKIADLYSAGNAPREKHFREFFQLAIDLLDSEAASAGA